LTNIAPTWPSGPESGVAVDIRGATHSVTLSKKELRETSKPLARIGIRIGAQARNIACIDNRMEGFSNPVTDLRSS
jgi:hypothetical protein